MQQEKINLILEIKHLSNELDKYYDSKLNFRNHCYLRIAFDNTIGDKWDEKVKKPFLKHVSEIQLYNVLSLLKIYLDDKNMLLLDNAKSLLYREKSKQIKQIKNPSLF